MREIFKIYKIIPVPVFFVDELPKGLVGKSYGIFVRILKDYYKDLALIQHELQHCRQWYRTLGLHGILYHISKRWRYRSEVEAYAVQLSYYETDRSRAWIYASEINENYGLDPKPEEEIVWDIFKTMNRKFGMLLRKDDV